MELEGILTRAHNVPNVRRKLPAPYARPRIDLDGGKRVKRSWKDTSVLDLNVGDTVANFGTLLSKTTHNRPVGNGLEEWKVTLYNILSEKREYGPEARVFAFSADDE